MSEHLVNQAIKKVDGTKKYPRMYQSITEALKKLAISQESNIGKKFLLRTFNK
jgi:hypothetical protein